MAPLILGFPWALALGVTTYGTISFLRHCRKPPNNMDVAFSLLPVSILKPLKGVDSGLEDNLESFFKLDYPCFELLFSVADEDDPAVAMVRKLMTKYDKVSASLRIGSSTNDSPNPKVNNLIESYQAALHDWLLISDSNVRVQPESLRRLVAHIRADTGIVTSIVCGQHGLGLGGLLEATYLNTFFARGMIIARDFRNPCVIGKSMLFSRKQAARFGGLSILGRYLAEDYMAGQAMRKLGLRVQIANEPVHQYIGQYSLMQFWSRHIRWGRIRKAQAPALFITEPFLGSLVSGIIGSLVLAPRVGLSICDFLTIHFFSWMALDYLVASQLDRTPGKPSKLLRHFPRWTLGWILRETLALPLWIHISLGNTVLWRGKKLTLEPGGTLQWS